MNTAIRFASRQHRHASSRVSACFSTMNFPAAPPNVMNMHLLESIRADIKAADRDRDGLLDYEDLKEFFRSNYSHLYSPEEVEEIGELLFVGKSGAAVKTTRLARGICHVMVAGPTTSSDNSESNNPLCLESLEDNRTKEDPRDELQPFYTTQQSFDRYMLKYIADKKKKNNTTAAQ